MQRANILIVLSARLGKKCNKELLPPPLATSTCPAVPQCCDCWQRTLQNLQCLYSFVPYVFNGHQSCNSLWAEAGGTEMNRRTFISPKRNTKEAYCSAVLHVSPGRPGKLGYKCPPGIVTKDMSPSAPSPLGDMWATRTLASSQLRTQG